MFTGMIEEAGTIKTIKKTARSRRFSISAERLMGDLTIGESISVNGACLTVAARNETDFSVDLSPETCNVTTLGTLHAGDRVNLERAMRLSDRMGGHLVSGHVDGIGRIRGRKRVGNAVVLSIEIPPLLLRYCPQKGSITLDGVSLTINRVTEQGIVVSMIPHTALVTTLGGKEVGDRVNIESDLIARYLERLMQGTASQPS